MAKEVQIRVGSSYSVAVARETWELGLLSDNARNLAEAQKHDHHPVSFCQLGKQFSIDDLRNAVLFDSSPESPFPGNHWRIIGIDASHECLEIQLCGPFGNYDVRAIPPFTVS